MVDSALKVASVGSVLPLQVLIVGKVKTVKRFDGKFYTVVLTPARDEYSRPQVLEVRSAARLGDVDDKVKVTCEIGGFERKAYEVVDKQTGERKKVVPVEITLDVIE